MFSNVTLLLNVSINEKADIWSWPHIALGLLPQTSQEILWNGSFPSLGEHQVQSSFLLSLAPLSSPDKICTIHYDLHRMCNPSLSNTICFIRLGSCLSRRVYDPPPDFLNQIIVITQSKNDILEFFLMHVLRMGKLRHLVHLAFSVSTAHLQRVLYNDVFVCPINTGVHSL